MISRSMAIELGKYGNWSWQRQDPWKYLDASFLSENSIKSFGQNHSGRFAWQDGISRVSSHQNDGAQVAVGNTLCHFV
jgi:hypothetical protein